MSFLKSYSVLTHLVPWQRAGPFCLWLFFGPFQALCLRTSSLTGQRRRGGDPTTPLCLARPVDSTGLQRSIHKGRSGHLKLDKTPKYPACKKGHQARTSRVAGALWVVSKKALQQLCITAITYFQGHCCLHSTSIVMFFLELLLDCLFVAWVALSCIDCCHTVTFG